MASSFSWASFSSDNRSASRQRSSLPHKTLYDTKHCFPAKPLGPIASIHNVQERHPTLVLHNVTLKQSGPHWKTWTKCIVSVWQLYVRFSVSLDVIPHRHICQCDTVLVPLPTAVQDFFARNGTRTAGGGSLKLTPSRSLVWTLLSPSYSRGLKDWSTAELSLDRC